MQKRIFLTGGNGFIGKNILEKLSLKYLFFAPTSRELDITDASAVSRYCSSRKFDIVIHGANIGGEKNRPYVPDCVEKNIKMFFNLVHNRKTFKKLIVFGSGAEYDKSRPLVNVSENDFGKRIPGDQYGFSKFVCSTYANSDPKITVLRLFGVFGKYENISLRFISNNICRSLMDLPITVKAQNAYFDYLYVDDLVKIVDYFITHDTKQHVFNVGTGKKIDLLTIAKKIHRLSNSSWKIVRKKKGLQREYTCDASRLIKEMKGFTFTDFDEALNQLYLWYKENPSMYRALKNQL